VGRLSSTEPDIPRLRAQLSSPSTVVIDVDRRPRSSLETLPVAQFLAFVVAALVLGVVAAALSAV
jgi:hypothetical protein